MGLWFLLACATAVLPAYARHEGAYSQRRHPAWLDPDWMARLPDSRYLNELSIPGTHNSMSRDGGDLVATQAMSLRAQLHAGVRAFDIRVRLAHNRLHAYHGPVQQGATLHRILQVMLRFLCAHPHEVLLVRLREEGPPIGSALSPGTAIRAELAAHGHAIQLATRAVPQLGSVRGRILLFSDFRYFSLFSVSDAWYLRTNWDLYRKWETVRDALDAARRREATAMGPPWGHATHLSASGGVFPYFAASGQVSRGDAAWRLATGLTTPAFRHWYPDFPRVNCFAGICTIAFEGINYLTLAYLRAVRPRYVGVVMADFPGPSLIREIIDLNLRPAIPGDQNFRTRGSPADRPPATDRPPHRPCLRG